MNKEKGIVIKIVTIKEAVNPIALHDKRDKDGDFMLDENGKKQPVDYVVTSNNHHVAVYSKPKLDRRGEVVTGDNGETIYEPDEVVVSFFEAVTRANQGLPIIDKEYKKDEGWIFQFTMKRNEYFVFPNKVSGFNPKEIDLLDPKNYSAISPNLFRVQQISYKNYVFRHHLETSVSMNHRYKGITWVDFRSSKGLDKIVKVRVNHIGQIVAVGEY